MKNLRKIIASFIIVLGMFSNIVPALATTYNYDALGRVIKVIYDSGQKVCYTYDEAGNIISITASDNSAKGGNSGSGSTGSRKTTNSYPEQISVTSPSDDGSYTAQIPGYVKQLNTFDTFQLKLGDVAIPFPVSELQSAMNGGNVKISVAPAGKTVLSQAAAVMNKAEIIDGFNISTAAESNIKMSAMITVNLPLQAISLIKQGTVPKICCYNPSTKSMFDTKAVFNLTDSTATFSTNNTESLGIGNKSSLTFIILAVNPKPYKLDTGSTLNVNKDKTYQFKITSAAKPVFVCGNGVTLFPV